MDKRNLYVNHLKWILVLSGAWPSKLISPKYVPFYNIYCKFLTLFFLISVTSFTAQMPALLSSGQYDKITENIGYVIINDLAVFRIYIINKPEMQNLIYELVEREKRIVAGGNEEILKIYMKYSRRAGLLMNALVWLTFLTLFAFAGSHYVGFIHSWDGSQTIERRLMYEIWIPINPQDYYNGVYVYEVTLISGLAIIYLASQHFSFIMMLFICGNLKVLQHFFTNVKKYSSMFPEIEDENERVFATFRLCVIEHQSIISFTERFNNTMKIICFLEFSTNSLQLASILLQFGVMMQNPVTLLAGVTLAVTTNTQMITSYFFANEIIVESLNVGDAVYEWDWYNYNSKKIAIAVQLVILRAQKNLALTIGPFGDMSLNTALKIGKGVFSYLTFMQQVAEEK